MLTMTDRRCPTATVNEAAEFLGVCRVTLYAMIRDGELASLKIRGSRRIRWADLERLVDGAGVCTEAAP